MEIHFTGLRQGEKMHEVLFSDREARAQSAHPIISHVRVEPVSPVEAPTARPPHDGVADRRGPWQQRDTERAQAGASERMSV
ncbi:polysaccharide biosynthesis protein [Tessaracoccus sp. Y1736]